MERERGMESGWMRVESSCVGVSVCVGVCVCVSVSVSFILGKKGTLLTK